LILSSLPSKAWITWSRASPLIRETGSSIATTSIIAYERAGLFVAEGEGKLAGYIHAFLRDTPAAVVLVPRRFAMIDSMAVGANQRRKGIGQALIAQVRRWTREQAATSVDLNVYEFNRDALLFYESLGFTTLRRWRNMLLEDEVA
jgi:GNAT superfamily N-acetyltransferase